MKVKVVHHKNLPTKLPINITLIAWLMLDRLDAPQLAWGIVGTVLAFIWIVLVIAMFVEEKVNLFPADGKIKVTRDAARDAAVD